MVLTCLFWNFRCEDSNRIEVLTRLADFHKVDILVLAESTLKSKDILGGLREVDSSFESPHVQHRRFQIFTRFPGTFLSPYREADRICIRRLSVPGKKEILLSIIHMYDRRNYTPDDQHALSRDVYSTLHEAEHDAGHTRTILFGDFNMNPFDKGMIDSGGFGAMMTRSLALRHSTEKPMVSKRFYNPVWSRMGRELPEPPGTYYFPNVNKPFNLYWHWLDQVLVRPALFSSFHDEDFRVLTSIPGQGEDSIDLIHSKRKHWKLMHSDHLPILFRLQLQPPMEIVDV